jgi:hypothetical protein
MGTLTCITHWRPGANSWLLTGFASFGPTTAFLSAQRVWHSIEIKKADTLH